MHCGVLCDTNGNVKRTWALINDTITVPIEDGDQVMEWEVDHGEALPHTLEKLTKIKEAVKEQERLPTLRVQSEVDAHVNAKQRDAGVQKVVIATPSSEPIYYSAGKGLHHRTKDAEGDVQENPVEQGNRLHVIKRKKAKSVP